MVATLTRGVNGGFAFAGERLFDAWGVVRAGASSGVPNQRYCASLGHLQDDETGLVYMRARYYEPGSGRFVSEDPARDGANWFVYCENSPNDLVDASGNNASAVLAGLANMFATWLFTGIGYLVVSRLYERMFPGYQAGDALGPALLGLAAGVMSALGSFAMSPSSEKVASTDIGSFVRSAMNSLRQPGVLGRVGLAAGIGMLIGTIMGILTAVHEFASSDFYANLGEE